MKEQYYLYDGEDSVEISQKVLKQMESLDHTINLTHSISNFGDICFVTAVSELFFLWRTNTSASLTITMVVKRNHIEAYAVASGAGAGLANLSWGAYKKIMKLADEMMINLGFQMLDLPSYAKSIG